MYHAVAGATAVTGSVRRPPAALAPATCSLPTPAEAMAAMPGRIELRFAYPEAFAPPGIANTYKRSIKLLWITLQPNPT